MFNTVLLILIRSNQYLLSVSQHNYISLVTEGCSSEKIPSVSVMSVVLAIVYYSPLFLGGLSLLVAGIVKLIRLACLEHVEQCKH